MSGLRNEWDLIRSLASGVYTVQDLYARAEAAGLADRAGGRKRIQDGTEQYKRRVRTALQQAKRAGRAHRVEAGQPAWFIEGTPARPRRALLVWLPADPSQAELVLGQAAEVLASCDEPIGLIVADPPWGLGRDDERSAHRRVYGRNQDQVVGGYVDVDPAAYADFTAEWIKVAGDALRPGGYLAVVTGPQQAARVQTAAEDVAGLTFVNSICVRRRFGLYATRRFVHSHIRVTLMCKGGYESRQRVFHRPEEMPRGRNGQIYAVDWWEDIPEERRNGLLRYDNMLHPDLASRLIRSTTNPGDLVADPFLGGGSTLVACLATGRRFYGGDVNPHSLRFTMSRVLAEVIPALRAQAGRTRALARQLTLFGPEGRLA